MVAHACWPARPSNGGSFVGPRAPAQPAHGPDDPCGLAAAEVTGHWVALSHVGRLHDGRLGDEDLGPSPTPTAAADAVLCPMPRVYAVLLVAARVHLQAVAQYGHVVAEATARAWPASQALVSGGAAKRGQRAGLTAQWPGPGPPATHSSAFCPRPPPPPAV